MWLSLVLDRYGLRFDQGILNRSYGIGREYGSRIDRARNRLFPRLQHCFHVASCVAVDQGVRLHEDAEEIAAEVDGVGSTDVLDNAIEEEDGW